MDVVTTPAQDVKIAVRGLTVDYEGSDAQIYRAIERVDIDLRRREFLCVIGPSGCGKSTLIGAIAGFLPLSEGSINLDGHAVKGPGADRGVVFQEFGLLPWLTVLGNVALGLKIQGIARQEREKRARHFLQMVGLSDAADKYPHQLSGGMKQRVAVARTLTSEPQVILMDEPFAAIDAQNRQVLQQEVLRLWETLGLTILFVTHSIDEAVFLGDRVVVMAPHPGRVAAVLDVPIDRERRIWPAIGSDPNFLRIRDEVHERVRLLHAETSR